MAWLRFVEEKGGNGIRAALFQTSAQGEPLDFCFTRRVWSGFWRTTRYRSSRVSIQSLAKSLLRAITSVPTLILARADEVPYGSINEEIKVQVPLLPYRNIRCSAPWRIGRPG